MLDKILKTMMDIKKFSEQPIEERRVQLTACGGLEVSTIYAFDVSSFETAIVDNMGAHPVERYTTKELALEGHARWVVFANDKSNSQVTQLGLPGATDSEVITLTRTNE